MNTQERHSEPSHDGEQQNTQDEFGQTLMEAHTIIPGILTLFGFQLITVFNPFLFERLDLTDRGAHFTALCLLSVAAAIVMTPAAYHRQSRPGSLSARFVRMTSRLITVAMVPLMIAFCCNLYLVTHVMFGSRPGAIALAAGFLTLFTGMWFVFPRYMQVRRDRAASQREHENPSLERAAKATPAPQATTHIA